MQPGIASRDGLGGQGDAGTDELREHVQPYVFSVFDATADT